MHKFYVKHRLLFDTISFLFSLGIFVGSFHVIHYFFPEFEHIDPDSDLAHMFGFGFLLCFSLFSVISSFRDFIECLVDYFRNKKK